MQPLTLYATVVKEQASTIIFLSSAILFIRSGFWVGLHFRRDECLRLCLGSWTRRVVDLAERGLGSGPVWSGLVGSLYWNLAFKRQNAKKNTKKLSVALTSVQLKICWVCDRYSAAERIFPLQNQKQHFEDHPELSWLDVHCMVHCLAWTQSHQTWTVEKAIRLKWD